jgi:type I restriction enzyme S subunit
MAYTDAALVEGEVLVVGRKGNLGQVQIFRDGVWPIDTVYYLKPPESLDVDYLFHLLVSQEMERLDSSTTTPSLRREDLEAVTLRHPGLDEQREIVRILGEQLSRLDAAAAAIATVRTKADQFRRSALHNDLKRLPSSCLRLDECAALTLGLMLDRGRETGKFQTPYLGNINVRWGSFDITALKTMDIRPEQMERSSARAGDIVVCEGGEPGRCAIWRESEPIAIQKALHRVRPNLRFLADYLALILESEFRGRRQHVLFTGTTIKHLPKERLRLVGVPDIALDEQERVVTGFRKVDDSVARTEAHCRQIEIGLIAARRALMHAAFTGELTKEWREKNNG